MDGQVSAPSHGAVNLLQSLFAKPVYVPSKKTDDLSCSPPALHCTVVYFACVLYHQLLDKTHCYAHPNGEAPLQVCLCIFSILHRAFKTKKTNKTVTAAESMRLKPLPFENQIPQQVKYERTGLLKKIQNAAGFSKCWGFFCISGSYSFRLEY